VFHHVFASERVIINNSGIMSINEVTLARVTEAPNTCSSYSTTVRSTSNV